MCGVRALQSGHKISCLGFKIPKIQCLGFKIPKIQEGKTQLLSRF